jgi:Aldo/keto reductases, related to diketogulonate reductase
MTMEITADAAGTVRLGDLEVPRLGFGAMRLPGPGVWGPPTDRDEAIRTVRRAVELGVRVIDSAWYYGLDVANEVIAAAIRPYPEDLVLITKLGGARTDDGTWVSGLTPERLRAGCERDLRVLGIEAVPVVHLRWMENLQIAYLPFFPLGAGRVATATGNALGAVAARHDATPAQVAIAWLLGRSPVMLPIPGTSKVAHLEDNVAAAALRLDTADLAELTTSKIPRSCTEVGHSSTRTPAKFRTSERQPGS